MSKRTNITTQSELARRMNRDKANVCRWLARPDWPFGTAPWPLAKLPEIKSWAARTLRDAAGMAADPELRKEKLRQETRKLAAQADAAEAALARERGDLHDAGECAAEAARRATLYRNGVAELPERVVELARAAGLPSEAVAALKDQVTTVVKGCLALAIGPE